MKATIRFTKYDFYSGRVAEESIVRVAEITHCIPMRGGFTQIALTNGSYLSAAESIDELERRIDDAEAAEYEPAQ